MGSAKLIFVSSKDLIIDGARIDGVISTEIEPITPLQPYPIVCVRIRADAVNVVDAYPHPAKVIREPEGDSP